MNLKNGKFITVWNNREAKFTLHTMHMFNIDISMAFQTQSGSLAFSRVFALNINNYFMHPFYWWFT